MNPIKQLMIHAVMGRAFLNCADASQMENKGFAKFSGNQHNESWAWNKEALGKLSTEELVDLYKREV